MHGQGKDFYPWKFCLDLSCGLDPIELGHGDIHDDDIRFEGFGLFYSRMTIFGFADDFKIWLFLQ